MRDLVLLFDGTWNRLDATHDTNVELTRIALPVGDPTCVAQYWPGVGTGRWDRIRGGALGVGLADTVEAAYRWLCETYLRGDRIFLFGYSRGAYTARSLAGLLGLCGIDDTTTIDDALRIYRRRDVSAAARFLRPMPGTVRFLGVWDTVGALGVPIDGLRWIGAGRHRWHDVRLGSHVENACHLVAVHEQRKPFAPALWRWSDVVVQGQQVEQVWFPGVHGDVGGGRPETGLSLRALHYMWERARAAGLPICGSRETEPPPIEECRPGDSMNAAYRLLGRHHRRIGACKPDGTPVAAGERIHRSALDLWEARPRYRDSRPGRMLTAAVEAGAPVVD